MPEDHRKLIRELLDMEPMSTRKLHYTPLAQKAADNYFRGRGWTIKTRRVGDFLEVTRLPDKPWATEILATIFDADMHADNEGRYYIAGSPTRLHDNIWPDGQLMPDTAVHRLTQFNSEQHVKTWEDIAWVVEDVTPGMAGRMVLPRTVCFNWTEVRKDIGLRRLAWKSVLQDEILQLDAYQMLALPPSSKVRAFCSLLKSRKLGLDFHIHTKTRQGIAYRCFLTMVKNPWRDEVIADIGERRSTERT